MKYKDLALACSCHFHSGTGWWLPATI